MSLSLIFSQPTILQSLLADSLVLKESGDLIDTREGAQLQNE
jgi:hypothetical protein